MDSPGGQLGAILQQFKGSDMPWRRRTILAKTDNNPPLETNVAETATPSLACKATAYDAPAQVMTIRYSDLMRSTDA